MGEELKNVEGYEIGGISGEEELGKETAPLNQDNEWHRQLKEYLLSGRLRGGEPAVKPRNTPQKPRIVSSRQQAALRR